jgi:hypothetical protein
MIGKQIEQIDAQIAPLLRVVDAYVDFIVFIEHARPGSASLTLRGGKTLSALERSDVSLFVYSGIYAFARGIVGWSRNINFETSYILFVLLMEADPDTAGTPRATIRRNVEQDPQFLDLPKMFENELVSEPPSLDLTVVERNGFAVGGGGIA